MIGTFFTLRIYQEQVWIDSFLVFIFDFLTRNCFLLSKRRFILQKINKYCYRKINPPEKVLKITVIALQKDIRSKLHLWTLMFVFG